MLIFIVWFTVLFGLGAYGLVFLLLRCLTAGELMRGNYAGQFIPTGLGIYLLALAIAYGWAVEWADRAFLLPQAISDALGGRILPLSYPVYLMALTAVGLTGWWDDRWGDRETKGIKGHWNKLFREGIVTSGAAKAVIALTMAVWISIQTDGLGWKALWGIGFIPLMTNTINLLDVRPGRALKAFIGLSLLLLAMTTARGQAALAFSFLFPLWIGAALLFPLDLRGKLMIGDTGANLLGFALGCLLFAVSPIWLLAIGTTLLVQLHRFAERRSITEHIAAVRWLSRVDRWGRPTE
ncbi:hypothetical protein [Paenibacillus sp. J2TS4]|uniref:hypothetical protein n=1 Tax=Paenibacillus sp. J2TS4 TaxID=2807194 RepID=UPI001B1C5836|nr:hypothetical protein [Paenibacillus sp. J2TS4]GIP32289.1 glycosyl transferase [Paenibacillus sp. J2TS4]